MVLAEKQVWVKWYIVWEVFMDYFIWHPSILQNFAEMLNYSLSFQTVLFCFIGLVAGRFIRKTIAMKTNSIFE